MTVRHVSKDPDTLSLTIVAEFDAPLARVWQIWADPRQLERWWGPPTWPATFTEHDFRPGGWARYYMTGPEGQRAHGWWRFVTIDAPHGLEFEDGFADAQGEPDSNMPTIHMRAALEPAGKQTRMTCVSTFASLEAMQQVLETGMEEGMTLAMGQIDEVLAAA